MRIKHDAAHCCQLITECQIAGSPCLYYVSNLHDKCYVVTNSGGKKRYVIGRLDNGKAFCERVKHLEES